MADKDGAKISKNVKYIANQNIGMYISKGSQFELSNGSYIVHMVGTELKLFLNKHYIKVLLDMKMLDKI
jgi:hypothetical protein